ncbi:SMI1/KNR4 family protein [Paenibacillus harenae]|uniref:Knr4/Smi1-like domain-containing protein n=1 Tax=Paenibacillus harenae TaxID=306543 RepID=A0ABT9TXB9_PAEHA|nr:SMI1/KNR4 family protein [Paenibacillus harenae]MDQ0110679.1 hypothetical protein [Paenibacillus harenae]
MEFNQFTENVNRLRASNPIWFALDADPIGTKAEISTVENQLNISLPEDYKTFIEAFGGGYFAFTVIYSVTDDSEWNILNKNQSLELLEKHHFLAVSDNQAGDYYGYIIENGLSTKNLFVYDHDDRQVKQTKYQNLFEYLVEVGLKQTV